MLTMTVEQTVHRKGSRQAKTRKFTAYSLGYVIANQLWEMGQTANNEQRPVYLTVAERDSALRPFLANLRSGRTIHFSGGERGGWNTADKRLKLMKKAEYAVFKKTVGEYQVYTFYLPEIFRQELGMVDKEWCNVLSVPPTWWVQQQVTRLEKDERMLYKLVNHLNRLGMIVPDSNSRLDTPEKVKLTTQDIPYYTVLAAHYMSMLDRRTKRPLVNDLRFAIQLYFAALAQGVASLPAKDSWSHNHNWAIHDWANGFWIDGAEDMGLEQGVITHVKQDRIDNFLTAQIQLYQEIT